MILDHLISLARFMPFTGEQRYVKNSSDKFYVYLTLDLTVPHVNQHAFRQFKKNQFHGICVWY